MTEPSSFADLMRRVRAGNDAAAAELVQRYESAIRRVVRYRLQEARMTTGMDSVDVCQSVMASFFVRAAAGQFEVDTPEQLGRLLMAMARKKVLFQQRKQLAQRRDDRRVVGAVQEDVAAPQASPSRQLAARDLLEAVRRQLSDEERQILDLRTEGLDWNQVAERLQGSPEALRKKLDRAVDRAAQAVGLDDWQQD